MRWLLWSQVPNKLCIGIGDEIAFLQKNNQTKNKEKNSFFLEWAFLVRIQSLLLKHFHNALLCTSKYSYRNLITHPLKFSK